MRSVASAALVLATTAAVLGGCGTARELEQARMTTNCTRCHDLKLGPPLEIDGRLVTAHEYHVERGVQCSNCHPGYSIDPETVNDATHQDAQVEASIEAGPYTKSVTFSDRTPTWPQTCSGCHTTLPPL